MDTTKKTGKSFLTFIPFTILSNWSVRYHLEQKTSYSDKYQLVEIGSFLSKDRTSIEIKDDIEYRRVTVKIKNGGVYLRDIKKGNEIGTKKQFVASEGQFIISKIDARNGAMGIIPSDLSGAIVTNDFPLFNINASRINPKYFLLNVTTDVFLKFAQSCSSGTTNRQRIDIDAFLKQKIPLPSLEEQNELIKKYNAKIKESEVLKQKAFESEKGIEAYFNEMLGIEVHKFKKLSKGLCFTSYKSLPNTWDIDFLNNTISSNVKYARCCIKDVCQISSGGTPNRNRKEYYNGNIYWIKTGELKDDVLYSTEEKITRLGFENSSAKLYPKESIVVAMYGATIGKTALLGVESTTNQACAVLFNINNNVILTRFLWIYIQLSSSHLKTLAYGSAQPNLNAGIIANYKILLPPISIQTEIVNHIQITKEEINLYRSEAEAKRVLAVKEFENKIFI